MPVVMEISFYHYYSGKSLMRLQSRDCTFVQKAGFSLQFHCRLTVKVCSVGIFKIVEVAGGFPRATSTILKIMYLNQDASGIQIAYIMSSSIQLQPIGLYNLGTILYFLFCVKNVTFLCWHK